VRMVERAGGGYDINAISLRDKYYQYSNTQSFTMPYFTHPQASTYAAMPLYKQMRRVQHPVRDLLSTYTSFSIDRNPHYHKGKQVDVGNLSVGYTSRVNTRNVSVNLKVSPHHKVWKVIVVDAVDSNRREIVEELRSDGWRCWDAMDSTSLFSMRQMSTADVILFARLDSNGGALNDVSALRALGVRIAIVLVNEMERDTPLNALIDATIQDPCLVDCGDKLRRCAYERAVKRLLWVEEDGDG